MPDEIVVIKPVAVRKPTAARMLDCGTTTIKALCKAGVLDVIKVGNDERVTVESIERYGKSLVA